jgi:hypothetical protein
VPDDWAEQLMAFNKEVGDEDDALTKAVQIGMKSGLPPAAVS